MADARPSDSELARLKQNPVSGLREVILDATVSPDVRDSGYDIGSYSLQVVWPFSLSENYKVISYSILPVYQLPGPAQENSTTGVGNTLLNFLVSPKQPGKLVWGAGPAVVLPTRSEPELGSNRAGLGPSGVLFYAHDAWSVGAVAQNVWSLGGSGRNEVNEFGLQYIFNYNLADGWYLYSNATITADWEVSSDERWTVPLGGGFGKVFSFAGYSWSASAQAFSNVETPSDAPKWSWNMQLSMMFP